ncbi:MAG: hypothetical protein LBO73_04300 [Holosporaceae bacterium]|jgi:hypothetical protein|nr:hypothetical protein [Holosporaceae bacterium]
MKKFCPLPAVALALFCEQAVYGGTMDFINSLVDGVGKTISAWGAANAQATAAAAAATTATEESYVATEPLKRDISDRVLQICTMIGVIKNSIVATESSLLVLSYLNGAESDLQRVQTSILDSDSMLRISGSILYQKLYWARAYLSAISGSPVLLTLITQLDGVIADMGMLMQNFYNVSCVPPTINGLAIVDIEAGITGDTITGSTVTAGTATGTTTATTAAATSTAARRR